MDYTKIQIPYIGNLVIKNKAETFRTKYWDKILPVDIEKIIDVNLKINIIPLPNLEKLCNTDALITSDWKSLYIDKDLFEDERRQNRLRFSLAHEIGHFVLHKSFYASLAINSFEDFYGFIELIPAEQYGYLETQANKFAGHLLAPRDLLSDRLDNELKRANKRIKIDSLDKLLLKSYIANSLSKKFGISQESMEIVLNEFDFFKDNNNS
ncbi:MAG: ImmA/IrrE family metallo-endopeptidase [Candidatus Kuenenbacteria bacterium]